MLTADCSGKLLSSFHVLLTFQKAFRAFKKKGFRLLSLVSHQTFRRLISFASRWNAFNSDLIDLSSWLALRAAEGIHQDVTSQSICATLISSGYSLSDPARINYSEKYENREPKICLLAIFSLLAFCLSASKGKKIIENSLAESHSSSGDNEEDDIGVFEGKRVVASHRQSNWNRLRNGFSAVRVESEKDEAIKTRSDEDWIVCLLAIHFPKIIECETCFLVSEGSFRNKLANFNDKKWSRTGNKKPEQQSRLEMIDCPTNGSPDEAGRSNSLCSYSPVCNLWRIEGESRPVVVRLAVRLVVHGIHRRDLPGDDCVVFFVSGGELLLMLCNVREIRLDELLHGSAPFSQLRK